MKKAKIVAAIVLAAAVSTTTLAAACGKNDSGNTKQGKEFSLANYAHALDSAYAKKYGTDYSKITNAAFTKVTKKNYTAVQSLGGGFVRATVKTTDGTTYTLYDVKNDKELFTGCNTITSNRISGSSYSFYYYVLGKLNNSVNEYQIVGPNGKLVVNKTFTSAEASYINFSYQTGYTDEDNTRYEFFRLTYREYEDNGFDYETVEKYFSYSFDKEGEIVWNVVTEDDLEKPVNSDYKAGSQLGLKKVKLGNSEIFPSSWDGITWTVEGYASKTYTFYKGDTKTSSFSIENGEMIGMVGNYVYFSEVVPVSAEATEGYNHEYTDNGATIKENWTLYRFDFVRGEKPQEVKTDYVASAEDASSLYNYSAKEFDRLFVTATKKVNGVAVESDSSKEYRLVVDEDFNISADLSAKSVSSTRVYKLKDNRYLAGSNIVDGDFNVVATLPGSYVTVWAEQGLLVCSNNMLVDFDGKVAVEPSNGSLSFYGDAAYNSYAHKIYSKKNPSGIKIDKLIAVNEDKGETVEYDNGVLVKKTPVANTDTGLTTYTYTVYDLNGKQLGKIENLTTGSASFDTIGGKLVLTAYVYTNVTTYATESVCWIVG